MAQFARESLHHFPLRFQLYRIADDGELHKEILGNPLEVPEFRPTSILWPGVLVTMESLCEDRATLVSFVTVPGERTRGIVHWCETCKAECLYDLHCAGLAAQIRVIWN